MTVPVEIDPVTGLRRGIVPSPYPTGPSTFDEMWVGRDPASIAVVDDEERWSTADLRAEVARVAACLRRDGIQPGDRVAWQLPGGCAGIVGFLATVHAGGIWVGIDPRATPTEVDALLADCEPSRVLDRLPDGPADRMAFAPVDRAQPAAIAYTSGTTGSPKGAVHTAQQLLYPAAAAIETEQLDGSSRIGTPLALSTLNIMLLGPITALACGGTAVMMRRADADGFAADVAANSVTRALVVPTIVHDLVNRGVDPSLLASLDRVLIGGAGGDRLRGAEASRSLGVELVASYGLSEAPTGVARMPVGGAGARTLPGVQLAVGPDGEITLAAASTGTWAGTWTGTLGYWRRPEATAALWREGVLHTGDVGTVSDDGTLLVSGRAGDMINRGGANIAPSEVETALLRLDGVTDAAVVGLADDRLGQVVAAAVTGTLEPDNARAVLRAELSAHKVPERWVTVETIPRNRGGKVDRRAIRALFA